MFLRPPNAKDKPLVNRSRKLAFTGSLPQKQQPFRATTEPDVDAVAPVPSRVHTPFVEWLTHKSVDNSLCDQGTREFLLQGPPYRGETAFGCNDNAKAAGARWVVNHSKPLDCEDKSVRRGWYSAPDERVLAALLELAPKVRDRDRRRCSHEPQWRCLGLAPIQNDQVKLWLAEFFGTDTQPRPSQPEASDVCELRAKRASREEVPQWILDAAGVPLRDVPTDTPCVECGRAVTDQFLDCACTEARWTQCKKCLHKYRTDDKATRLSLYNVACACDRAS